MLWGYVDLAHLMSERVVDASVGFPTVWKAITTTADYYNRELNAMLSSIVERTTDYSERVYLPGAGTLQPLNEYMNPRPVRPSGYFDVAYPIQMAGTAFGDTIISRAKLTVNDVMRNQANAQIRDRNWMRRHILAALLDNTTWVYPDEKWGSLTIQPLANGDTVAFPRNGGADAAVDTHHLYQAATISDANNPFSTIVTELREHPGNEDGQIVAYVPLGLEASIRALTSFHKTPDANVVAGSGADRLVNIPSPGFGQAVLGYTDDGVWIVEWLALPAGYMLAHAQGGGPVLKMREEPEPELQGFFVTEAPGDGNLKEVHLRRRCGFGVSNRVGAVVMQIGAGSYSVPSGYSNPLPE